MQVSVRIELPKYQDRNWRETQIMGNVLEQKMFCEKPVAMVEAMPVKESHAELEAGAAEEKDACKTTVGFHLFHYRRQLASKPNHVVKWAASKLQLTEELIKQQQQTQSKHFDLSAPLDNFDDDDDDATWAEKQLAILTDDEDDENMENLNHHKLDTELNALMNYRSKLRETLIQESQEKLRKREKIKLKRLKRRLLISSKKPSMKEKHRPLY